PRTTFDEASIDELAASIREVGLLQPIVVRKDVGGGYELIAGARRLRAVIAVSNQGGETIPAMVLEADDDQARAIAIVENLQREDLHPLDEADAYRAMAEECGLSVQQISDRCGRSRGYVAV